MEERGERQLNKSRNAEKVFEQCYKDYRIKIFNYCLSRLEGSREKADDCTQETFIVFYNKLLDGEKFENPRAFIYRTADNFIKRQKQRTATELKYEIPLEKAAEIEAFDDEYASVLNQIDYDECAKLLLNKLDEEELKIYRLRYIENNKVEAIAEQLGISRPAASMRLLRLRNKIKELVYSFDIETKGVKLDDGK